MHLRVDIVPPPSPTPTSAASAPSSVDDRATSFQPVEGGTEHRSGETLLVSAYAGIWIILMGWLLMQWRKQGALSQRVNDLEATLDAAAVATAKPSPGVKPSAAPSVKTAS
jgi:hypothetical protein